MSTSRVVAVFVLLTLVGGLPATAAPSAEAGGAPTHSVSFSGTGTTVYPAFDPSIDRYGIRTTTETGDSVNVTASTSDPSGTITVNGRPATDGVALPVDGLEPGDEIAVQISDSGGDATYAAVFLDPQFPALTATTVAPGAAEGSLFLTLASFFAPGFDVVIDDNGVPRYVSAVGANSAGDFKLQPDGRYSAGRATSTPGRSGEAIVALDGAFEPSASYETVGLVNTDFHDSILRPDGSRILIAYEGGDGQIDAVIQEIDPAGTVVFEWNSKDHVPFADANVSPGGDYAHINSIFVMDDGDFLASFRNTGQVLKIARTAHDGFAVGDVVWRLGGKTSDFTFVDDPLGGICAQHHAQELDNGNILLFDNGSQFSANNAQMADMCPDPADPGGPRIARPLTRVLEYDLDEQAMTATLDWTYDQDGLYSAFAGSVVRFDNGNTLIGWAQQAPTATEIDASGAKLWELNAPGYFSYRVFRSPAPDGIVPEAVFSTVPSYVLPGASATADFSCKDRGGSSLATCAAATTVNGVESDPFAPGSVLDTSTVGEHELKVTATDGAGNTGEDVRTYTVLADHGFSDVPPWVDTAVAWLASEGHIDGYSDQTFRPNDSITRAQVARVLWRIAGAPTEQPEHGFSDVPPWVDTAVAWLASEGHIDGYPDGTFRPNDPIGRGQVARVLWRIAGSPTAQPPHGLSDVPAWAEDAVRWAVANGFMTGYPGGTFRAGDAINRAQVANVLFSIVSTLAAP